MDTLQNLFTRGRDTFQRLFSGDVMANPYAGPIPRSYWVREDKLLAGPIPARQVETLAAHGITAIIDLTETQEADYTPYLPDDMTYRRFPIRDFATPQPHLITEILDTIDALLDAGETVYVHCWAGIGRTGTIIGCWLVRHGMTGEGALALIEQRRGRAPETEEQREMVRHWAQISAE